MGEVDAEAGVGQGREGTRLDELVLLQVGWEEEHASGGRRSEAQVVGERRQQGKTGYQPVTTCSPDRSCYVPERLRIMADLIAEWGSQKVWKSRTEERWAARRPPSARSYA